MANYIGWIITNKGLELLSKAAANQTRVNITKLKTGSGYSGGDDRARVSLINLKNEYNVSDYRRKEDNTVEFTFYVSNKAQDGRNVITSAYRISEMGIFAEDDQHNEILFAYNKATEGDYITPYTGNNPIEIIERCVLAISQNINITINIDNSLSYVTRNSYATNTDYGLVTLNQVRNMIPDVPNASTTTTGKVQLSSSTNSNSETVAATSKAVKSVYDLANSKQSPATTLAGYGITNFKVENARGNLNDFRTDGHYYFSSGTNLPSSGAWHIEVISGGNTNNVRQIARKVNNEEVQERYYNGSWSQWKKVGSDGIQVGSIVSFPKEITNPAGFLRCDGSTFSSSTYPDLYQVMGRKNKLPDLRRSDVGMLAYFPQDTIPEGWLACNGSTISSSTYPELHRYLNNKYGSNKLPNAEDRFIRNAGGGLRVGQTQTDEIKSHTHIYSTSYVGSHSGLYHVNTNDTIATGNYRNLDNYTERTGAIKSTGGSETRPKSIVFKLCIKAKNTFDDVVFWIKAFGEVVNSGSLDAGRLAQDIQIIRSDVSNINSRIRTATDTVEGFVTLNKIREILPNMSLQWRQIYNGTFTGTRSSSGISLPSSWNECLVYYSGQGDRRKVSTILIPSTSLDLDYSTDQWEVVEGKVRVSSNKLYITDRGSGNDGCILRVCIR